MRLAVAVILLGGCAQLFGLDPTTGGGPGSGSATPDAPPAATVASLKFVRMSIGSSVVRAPQDLTGMSATYLIPDPSASEGLRRVPAMLSGLDTWSAEISDAAPPIEFTLPDVPIPITRLWALPSRTVIGLYGQLEHPHATPAPSGATLAIDVALGSAYGGAESFQLLTVGSWTLRSLTPPGVGATALQQTIPFAQQGANYTGRPFEKITHDDTVLVLRYSGNTLNGYCRAAPFDQTGSDTVAGALQPVAYDQPLAAQVHPAAVPPRYANVRPTVTNVSMAFYLHAAPGYSIASNTGPMLDAIPVQPTDSGQINKSFTNPFASSGWHTIITWATSASRTFTAKGLPVTLYAGMNHFAEPTAGLDLTLPSGLPTSISIAQQALLSDGMVVAIDHTKPVELSFVPDQPDATLCQFQLYELVPNATNTALQYTLLTSITGVHPMVTVPPDLFQPGHYYTLRAVTTVGGYPTLLAGDLTNRTLPLSQAYADSGVFTVTAM